MYYLAVFPPLLAAIVAGLFGRSLGDRGAQVVTCGAMTVAALSSLLVFFFGVDAAPELAHGHGGGHGDAHGGGHGEVAIYAAEAVKRVSITWIHSGDLVVDWVLRFDTLSAVMVMVVNLVSCAVHYYSIGYMSHDPDKPRFMAYLSLFTFMMLMLVTADNFVQMFFGWEGVGLASYLLIGFWYQRPTANRAAIKAFIVNRVGDFGFALGIAGVFLVFGSLDFDFVFAEAPRKADATIDFLGFQLPALEVVCLLLFMGAMGKSAQLGLHTWLPDAMEGPTPVSALIHAATMVTAGVFMLVRCSYLFEYAPTALEVVTIVGALTAFVAATIGMTQFDIKRVIAYSTMSQLGYMFFAIGVSAYSAAMFHLFTHAFFKALLFLGAGSVIHAMSDEQDMRKMGGVWHLIPQTYAVMWIGSLALAGIGIPGIYGFAGFYSKDVILEAAYADGSLHGIFAFWLGIVAAFMTAFYSWRLLLMTFHGAPRANEHVMAHVHESPNVMLYPLSFLGLGALFAGSLGHEAFVGHDNAVFWARSIFVLPENDTVAAAHDAPLWVALLPLVAGLSGIFMAWKIYEGGEKSTDDELIGFGSAYRLSFNKWYFDDIYAAVIERPVNWAARGLWQQVDQNVIDAFGPDGVASATQVATRQLVRFHTGYVFHYAFAMLLGIVLLLGWYLMATFN